VAKSEKFSPSECQRIEALERVRYEIAQLTQLCYFFRAVKAMRVEQSKAEFRELIQNAWLESVLVHVRNLMDFFTIDTADRHKDDVLAADFGFAVHKIVRFSRFTLLHTA